MMQWKPWLSSLGVAAISGAACAASDALQEPTSSGKVLAAKAAVGALGGVALYLKQSPIQPRSKRDSTRKE